MKTAHSAALMLLLSLPGLADEAVQSAVLQAVREGKIAYKLTTPEELAQIAGPPDSKKEIVDGGMARLDVVYPSGVFAWFTKMREEKAPYTLNYIKVNGKRIPLEDKIILRSPDDLDRIDAFWGLAGVSLARLDLRDQNGKLNSLPFDTRTLWPPQNKMPEGFDPAELMESGKNPGIGIKALHAEGIDGSGVGIAILDQPLLKDHIEYKDRLADYQVLDLTIRFAEPQMHGPPVCSIAVGAECGVAPKARLYYFAYPSWKWGFADCTPYCRAVERIIQYNADLPPDRKIRVISNSFGGFSQMPNYEQWQKVVQKACENGILVVTCDPAFLKIRMLKHKDGRDWDHPESFELGRYGSRDFEIAVPASNRTIASHRGPDVYTFERQGGMSWTVPWLAGLAALACQVNPDIEPAQIVELWKETAAPTDLGPVIDPPAFIEKVKQQASK